MQGLAACSANWRAQRFLGWWPSSEWLRRCLQLDGMYVLEHTRLPRTSTTQHCTMAQHYAACILTVLYTGKEEALGFLLAHLLPCCGGTWCKTATKPLTARWRIS